MDSDKSYYSQWAADSDFEKARRRANIEQLYARLTQKPAGLLSYSEVLGKLRTESTSARGLHDIPLASIIGTVGRYGDFTRTFLPAKDSGRQRWVNIMVAAHGFTGLPPIEVYKIDEAYFVKDGHHRVSVANQMGIDTIQAYVTEVKTHVELTPESDMYEILLQVEYNSFRERTRIAKILPDAHLSMSVPGAYEQLEQHIQVHRYFMGIDQQTDVTWREALTHWYDNVYHPVEESIIVNDILQQFPDRTAADLYLWIMENRSHLEEELGWNIQPVEAAAYFGEAHGNRIAQRAKRFGSAILDALLPDSLEAGPPPGTWRQTWIERMNYRVFFFNIMVPISKEEESWETLEQAIRIAQREGGHLRGLHVVNPHEDPSDPLVYSIKERFDQRCQEAGISGNMVIEQGRVSRVISERARWVDLIVTRLAHPPNSTELSNGFQTIINRSPRPVLALPGKAVLPKSALVAYDNSPKAREALYTAAYIANNWRIPITVLHVQETHSAASTHPEARQYFDKHNSDVEFIQRSGSEVEAILEAAAEINVDMLIMGGYGRNLILRLFGDSTVDSILRRSPIPILVCR
jgi:nucleotide-binding universal stress UspA family protein